MKTLQSVAQINKLRGVSNSGLPELTPVQFQQQRFQNQEILKQENLNKKAAVEVKQFDSLKTSLGMLDSDIQERAMLGVENIIKNVPGLSQLRSKIDAGALSGKEQKQFIEASRNDFSKAGEPGEITKEEASENIRLRIMRMIPGLREMPSRPIPKSGGILHQPTPKPSKPTSKSKSALLNIIKR